MQSGIDALQTSISSCLRTLLTPLSALLPLSFHVCSDERRRRSGHCTINIKRKAAAAAPKINTLQYKMLTKRRRECKYFVIRIPDLIYVQRDGREKLLKETPAASEIL
jgi:hypothetical protein